MREALRKLRKGTALLMDGRFRPGMVRGVAAAIEHEAALKPYDFRTVVDIGANRGQFTLLIAGLFPGAEIVAFEPLIEPFKRLVEVTANRPHVQTFNLAIGPARASVAMNVARRDDSSSLLPIGDLQQRIFPNTGLDRREEVQVAPLMDYLDPAEILHPALLKIDVQGYELKVIEGSRNLLGQFDVLYVEASFLELYEGQPLASDVIDVLKAAGFRLAAIHNLAKEADGRAVQADFPVRAPAARAPVIPIS